LEPKALGETVPSGSGDPWLGRVIKGKYRCERLLGRGGFGAVYAARQLLIGTWHAVKVLHPATGVQPELIDRFREEARIGTQLRHQRIVPVTDFDVEDETFFLVMDYIESRTLAERMRETPDEVAGHLESWARDIAAALDYAHSQRVVHRDVKPSNILIREQDQAALLSDFGISRLQHSVGLTQVGATIGTFAYMSPEQCRDEERAIDARSDVYSLAAVLFELVCGRPPYGNGREALSGHQFQAIPRVRQFRPEHSAAERLDAVFARGLAKSPNQRPQSAEQLVNEFADAISGATVAFSSQDETVRAAATAQFPVNRGMSEQPPSPRVPLPPPPRPVATWRDRKPLLIALGVAALAVVLIGSTFGVLAATGAFRQPAQVNLGLAAAQASPSAATTRSAPSPSPSPSPVVFVGPMYVDSLQLTGDQPAVTGVVTIGSQRYQHGLQFNLGGFGAQQRVFSVEIPVGAHKFTTAIGSDVTNPNGNFMFEVFVDGTRLDQRLVQGDSAPQTINVDVTGKSTVKLVLSRPGGPYPPAANWGDPQFN
jgi:serine/threonine-protein kinase